MSNTARWSSARDLIVAVCVNVHLHEVVHHSCERLTLRDNSEKKGGVVDSVVPVAHGYLALRCCLQRHIPFKSCTVVSDAKGYDTIVLATQVSCVAVPIRPSSKIAAVLHSC